MDLSEITGKSAVSKISWLGETFFACSTKMSPLGSFSIDPRNVYPEEMSAIWLNFLCMYRAYSTYRKKSNKGQYTLPTWVVLDLYGSLRH